MSETKSNKEIILEKLNDQQKLPVLNYNGPSIVVAGAGSGKTFMIVSRAAYMIEDGIDPRNILMFTFTRKGAEEIKSRVISYIGEKSNGLTVSTYHSFCLKVLRRFATRIGWKENFTIVGDTEQEELIKKITKKYTAEISPGAIISEISSLKDQMISPVRALELSYRAENAHFKEIVAKIYNEYQRELKASNAFDFDDLIYFTIRLFEHCPDVREKINNKYKYIVADESQDSSPRDLKLITFLGGKLMNVCLVGDDYQS